MLAIKDVNQTLDEAAKTPIQFKDADARKRLTEKLTAFGLGFDEKGILMEKPAAALTLGKPNKKNALIDELSPEGREKARDALVYAVALMKKMQHKLNAAYGEQGNASSDLALLAQDKEIMIQLTSEALKDLTPISEELSPVMAASARHTVTNQWAFGAVFQQAVRAIRKESPQQVVGAAMGA
jgi:hypothetical protein